FLNPRALGMMVTNAVPTLIPATVILLSVRHSLPVGEEVFQIPLRHLPGMLATQWFLSVSRARDWLGSATLAAAPLVVGPCQQVNGLCEQVVSCTPLVLSAASGPDEPGLAGEAHQEPKHLHRGKLPPVHIQEI